MRITEAFRSFGVELKVPQWTTSGVSENPRQVVLSLWAHNFSDGMSRYKASMAKRRGPGKHSFLQSLRTAVNEDLPIRVVVATAADPNEVRSGNAAKAKKDFAPHPDLVGHVVRFEGAEFELAFSLEGVAGSAPTIGPGAASLSVAGLLDPDLDARKWALQVVALRQGQGQFRAQLLEAYGSRCAITGCSAVEALEAAHIHPFRGLHTNRIDNGLLLRADVHSLFDQGLIWIGPARTIEVAPSLMNTEYASLRGNTLSVPKAKSDEPALAYLAAHATYAQNCQPTKSMAA